MKNTTVDPTIFLLNDIRGLYPKQLNEASAHQIGMAYVEFLRRQTKEPPPRFRVAVARDVRPSSSALFRALTTGIREQGANVYDIGLVTTPMMYFSVIRYKLDGGVMITASHNPNPFNGLKMVGRGAMPISDDSGLRVVRAISRGKLDPPCVPKGWMRSKKIERDYFADIFTFFRGKKKGFSRSFRIAVDTGNGLAGRIIPAIARRAGITVKPLYFKPDGNFPNHIPDPMIRENLNDLIKLIKKEEVDFGVAFDGDGDRIFFVDHNGKPISGDLIIAFIARELLKTRPREKIIYDIRSSNIVEETVTSAGGIPVCSPIGHSVIKKRMRRGRILFGGELSGHYYLEKNRYIESPFFL